MPNLKQLSKNAGLFSSGHRACAGCGAATAINQVMTTAGPNTVVCFATGCIEVVSTIYPYSAWNVPYIHVAFENAAAVISGVEAAYKSLKRQGRVKQKLNFIAFGGDGGTYDIGLQALSGALERRHSFLYICYDNEAYMNTGIQRSSATPKGSHTTTSPAGTVIPGKTQHKKDLTEIVIAHEPAYVAQASPSNWIDLTKKVEKALNTEGPSFINILAPCPLGWRFLPEETIRIARLAVETRFWPLYEYEQGKYKLTYRPKKNIPLQDWLKTQGRFAHLFTPEHQHIATELQQEVELKWQNLLKKVETS